MDSLIGLLKTIFPCLPIGIHERGIQLPAEAAGYLYVSEKAALHHVGEKPRLSSDEAASSIVSALLEADKTGPSLDATIQSLVHQAGGWTDYLMKKILAGLENVLKADKPLKGLMQEAYNKACKALEMTEGFVHDHPMATAVFCTVIALGILVVLAPYVVEYLGFCFGFGEMGPIEGSWAAAWQSTYRGLVPTKSLFSYFQRLGMTWKHV